MRKTILILLLLPFSCLAAVNWTNYPNTNVPAWNDTFLIGNLGLKTNLQVTSSNLEVFLGGIYGTNVLPVGYIATNQNATLTGSLLIGDGARGVKNTAVGAVPIDGDGTATTFAQVNALASGTVLTNGHSVSATLSNNVTLAKLLAVTGGTPTLTTNVSSLLCSNAVLAGNDTAMTLTFTTSAATQQANSNYFTINFANTYGANAVIPTASNYGSNSVAGIQGWAGRFTIYSTAGALQIYSTGAAPNSSALIEVAIHVDRF